MTRSLLALGILLSTAGTSFAQDDPKHALTPTDVLEFGTFSLTGRLQLFDGDATFRNPAGTVDVDLDTTAFAFAFQGAVGLGQGFEVEVEIPYQFIGTGDGDGVSGGAPFELESESDGFGDLQVSPIYRLLLEDATTPQWVIGAVVIAPTGNDKRGRAEVTTGGVTTEGEEGGIGSGVWSYGIGTAVSKRFGAAEPYVGAQYLIGGKREMNDVDEDRSDVGTIFAGSEWHLSPNATLDTSLFVQFNGEDVTEDSRVKVKEESHLAYGAQAQAYIHLGGGFSILAGASVFAAEDHEVDDTAMFDLEDSFAFGVQAGIHFLFGGK